MNDLAIRILNARRGRTHLFSLGQAGFVVKSANGQLLGIDLYLSECVERVEGHVGFKRLLPKLLHPLELEFDVLIATHPHFDHFDMDSMPLLMSSKHTVLYASVNCEREVERLMMNNEKIQYVKPEESYVCGDFTLDFIKCDHGTGAPDAVGVVVTVDGKKICEVGDTCLRKDWSDMYIQKGPLDLLIAPINGAYGNLNEEECAELSVLIKPKLVIPCHYGMFATHGGNPGVFYEIMKKQYPKQDFLFLSMGEEIEI